MAPRRYTKLTKCIKCGTYSKCDPEDNICERCRVLGAHRDRYRLKRGLRFEELEGYVHEWADARGIFSGSNPEAQMTKLSEENTELMDGILAKDIEAIKDGIGDKIVVLTIIAHMTGLTVTECYNHAYQQIKDRKGKMVDGVFVKEV